MQELIQMVLNKDPAATLLAKQVGPTANPDLQKLAKNADEEVRCIALYCLDETGGYDVAKIFVEALMDEDSQVRAAALRGLYNHPDLSVYNDLLHTYDKSSEPYVRQQISLVIGLMRGIDVKDLKKRYEVELDPEAKEGCIVALARLNDKEAQVEFINRLHASTSRVRSRYLEYCEYIHATWLIKPLLPLLDDISPMVYVGVDAFPNLIQYLRACDLAMNLIASISKYKFSFVINRGTNYNDDQIAEVRHYVQGLP